MFDNKKELKEAKDKIASLTNELTKMNEALAASQNDTKIQVDARQTDLDQIVELNKKIADLDTENAVLVEVNKALTLKLEELGTSQTLDPRSQAIADEPAKVNNKKPAELPALMFTVDGKSYKFISPVFMYQKKRIVAADAILDQELLNELVAAKIGVIKEA